MSSSSGGSQDGVNNEDVEAEEPFENEHLVSIEQSDNSGGADVAASNRRDRAHSEFDDLAEYGQVDDDYFGQEKIILCCLF